MKQSRTIGLNAELNLKEVQKELCRLGSFTPKQVVETATAPSSPLHKYFEWDDSRAAHAYRLTQARHLVGAIYIDSSDGPLRAYESVVIDSQKLYVPVATIAESKDLVAQVLKAALNELIFWKTKHQRHQHFFGGIFDEIDKSEEALRRKNEKASTGGRRAKARNTTNKKDDSIHHHRR